MMSDMNGFGLLVGHLLGDYLAQNDWMAKWKSGVSGSFDPVADDVRHGRMSSHYLAWRPFIACTTHCLIYTLSVWACSFWWMPWWGLLLCFALHFPLDRWRLARRLMDYTGQTKFATGPLSPWSIIVVDNTLHLLTLLLIGVTAQ